MTPLSGPAVVLKPVPASTAGRPARSTNDSWRRFSSGGERGHRGVHRHASRVSLLARAVGAVVGPRRGQAQQTGLLARAQCVTFSWGEGGQRARPALGFRASAAQRDLAAHDLDDGPLAHLMLAHLLARLEVDHDRAARRRGEEHARLAFARRLDRRQVPALHGGHASRCRTAAALAEQAGVALAPLPVGHGPPEEALEHGPGRDAVGVSPEADRREQQAIEQLVVDARDPKRLLEGVDDLLRLRGRQGRTELLVEGPEIHAVPVHRACHYRVFTGRTCGLPAPTATAACASFVALRTLFRDRPEPPGARLTKELRRKWSKFAPYVSPCIRR